MISCSNSETETKIETATNIVDTNLMYFGDSISIEGALIMDSLKSAIGNKDSVAIKLTGVIDEICQKKGCWMNLKTSEGEAMRVSFKDYAFFMPMDAAGKTVFIEGYAYKDTTSVEELKHYASDAGQTKEEIAKITNPEISLSFEASGVVIKK